MSVVCKTNENIIKFATEGRKKQAWTPAELSEIRRRTELEHERLALVMKESADTGKRISDEVAAAIEKQVAVDTAMLGDLVRLTDNNYSKVEAMLARQFGALRGFMGFGSDFSTAGAVRKGLLDTNRVVENTVSIMARLTAIPRVRELNRLMKDMIPTLNKRERDKWITRFIEEGGMPRSRATYGDAVAEELLNKRYNRFLEDAQVLGLETAELDELIEASMKVANSYDEIRLYANKWGLNVGQMENIGFFARNLTENARIKLEIAQKSAPEPFMPGFNLRGKTPKYKDERSAWIYTPRDLGAFVRLAAGNGAEAQWRKYLRGVSKLSADELDELPAKLSKEYGRPATMDDVLESIAMRGGTTLEELKRVESEMFPVNADAIEDLIMNDVPEWISFLQKTFTGDQLDALVDSGVMSRIPMTTTEVFEYLVKQYQLPFKDVSEVFITDPQGAIAMYGRKLRKLAGDSAMLQRIVDDGYTQGWVVSDQVLEAGGDTYEGFITLKGLDLAALGIDPVLVERLGHGNVHPLVFNQLEGMLRLSTSPRGMAELGNVIAWLNRNMNVGALLRGLTGYVSRIAYGNTIQYTAGGGNLLRLIPAHMDIIRVMRNGLDVLDNERPFLKDGSEWLTKRQAFEQFIKARYSEIIPLGEYRASGDAATDVLSAINPVNLPRAIIEAVQYGQAYGGMEGFQKTIGKLGTDYEKFIKGLFLPAATVGNVMENAFRWALIQSVATKKGVPESVQKGLRFVSRIPEFDTLQEIIEYTDRYFIDYRNVGSAVEFYGRYVRPFGIYAAKNPMMVTQNVLRHPSKYMAYGRLLTMINENQSQDVTEAGFAEFELDNLPLVVGHDPSDNTATVVYPTNFDPISDTFVFYRETTETLINLLGGNTGSNFERRGAVLGKQETLRSFIAKSFGSSLNPVIGGSIQFLTGKDGLGREIDKQEANFMGFSIPGGVNWLLNMYSPISGINQAFGGNRRVNDALGREIIPARPSILGITPQGEAGRGESIRLQTEQKLGLAGRLIRDVAGVRIQVLDLSKGNQKTFDALRRDVGEVGKLMNKLEDKYKEPDTTPQQREDIQNQLLLLARQRWNMQVDLYRVGEYMRRKKIPSSTELEKMRDDQHQMQGIRIPDSLAQQAASDILRYQQLGQ